MVWLIGDLISANLLSIVKQEKKALSEYSLKEKDLNAFLAKKN